LNRLVDTRARGGNFIDVKVAQMICEKEGISPMELVRPRLVLGYDGREGHQITYILYLPL
jgi:hypothetical protein